MTTVLLIVLWLLAITLVFVLIVLGANRELRERQEWLTEMLDEVNRENANLKMSLRCHVPDEQWTAKIVERFLGTL